MAVGSQPRVEAVVPQFKEYFLKLKTTLRETDLLRFGKLGSDEERIEFVSELIPYESQPSIEIFGGGKDERKSKELKDLGNKAFGKSDYKEALRLYSESCVFNPQIEGATDLALTIANRSAVLYHLQEYQLAINDVDVVLSLNYPKDLLYKIYERKAKCLLALRKHEEALIEFRNTIKALDECKLSSERKLKIQTDIQIMLGIMTKPTLSNKNLNTFLESSTGVEHPEQECGNLSVQKNQIYEAASKSVDIREDPLAGRFASASEDIAAGDAILFEKAYCSVLLEEYSKSNCQHCFKRTLAPFPCDKCSFVIFCSMQCKESACASYHKYECPVFTNLHQSGISVTVLMALRIVSQKDLIFFLQLRDKLQAPEKKLKKYKSSDYTNVYNLVRHEGLRKRDDFFERSVMALFLLRCLKKANYFGVLEKGGEKALRKEEKFIGGLLLRHLQILQFNAHEISELEIKQGKGLDDSKSVFIGGGLYVTLALFNHSCDPGIVRMIKLEEGGMDFQEKILEIFRYFEGTKVVVRAVKPIKKGEMIAENYGPIYSQMKKKERQEKLQAQYWFECKCSPCEEHWPTFEEIDKSVIRFRCDARKPTGEKFNDCKNVLQVPINIEDFMIKCFLCGQMTNLLKGLKTLQGTDAMYQQASKDLKKGNYKAALGIYLEILSTLHEILAPPFRDYLLCQQSIRKCMLAFGNKHALKPL